jgi:cyanate permease
MSPGAGGLILALSSITAVIVRLVAGWLADRRSGGHLVRIAMMLAVGAAGCIGAAWAPNDLGFILACIVIGGAGWGIAGLFHFAVIRIQPDAPGRASGVAQVGLFVGAAAGPVAFGYAAEFLTMKTAWMLMAAWMTLASGFVIAARVYIRPIDAAAAGGR